LADPASLVLLDEHQREVSLQTQVLTRWPGGSVQWLLLDFLAKGHAPGQTHWLLKERFEKSLPLTECGLHVYETEKGIAVATGVATFHLSRRYFQPFQEVLVKGRDLLDGWGARTVLADLDNRTAPARIKRVVVEDKGCVRATLRFEGRFKGTVRPYLLARLCFFAGTGLVRLRLTLHNPNRARHPGGLWDLGDRGSMFFRDMSMEMKLDAGVAERLSCTTEGGSDVSECRMGNLEIYQDSSGGADWQSRNHVNRRGRVPCSFRGYRLRSGETEKFGYRASPVVSLHGPGGGVTAALPEFWQQFPKAFKVGNRVLRVGFFPGQNEDGYELQGGERKTHTLWLDFTGPGQPPFSTPVPGGEKGSPEGVGLDWVHQPAMVLAPPEWYAGSGVLGPFAGGVNRTPDGLEEVLAEVRQGPRSLLGRRETGDEFGWRHFGEWYADHEAEHYSGPPPIVSHYNNQYDCVLGALLQYLRTGDGVWWQVGEPLARHVIDIDRYHTTRDKAAYNGGLFWFTDHYRSAETCTHRTYSGANRPANGQDYGGGPSSNHNFTSGLLLYYLLTGDPEGRAAVVGLADWVVAMDDGCKNLLGLLDSGPTGLASYTGDLAYHGPGRGAGNSINALLDAWLLTGQRHYLAVAEALIRRSIHPSDDIAARDLLNVEKRWSYTVFLVALDRYLRIKADRSELDAQYDYAQQSLLAYAAWMKDHEIPYFDQRERLEYPTEAWAGQELRKANVLRLAAAHADEPQRSALLQRGEELAARGWRDMLSFESRVTTRAVALLLVEGLLDHSLRTGGGPAAPRAAGQYDHGVPETFVPQKHRVFQRLKSCRGVAAMLFHALNPYHWATVSWRC